MYVKYCILWTSIQLKPSVSPISWFINWQSFCWLENGMEAAGGIMADIATVKPLTVSRFVVLSGMCQKWSRPGYNILLSCER